MNRNSAKFTNSFVFATCMFCNDLTSRLPPKLLNNLVSIRNPRDLFRDRINTDSAASPSRAILTNSPIRIPLQLDALIYHLFHLRLSTQFALALIRFPLHRLPLFLNNSSFLLPPFIRMSKVLSRINIIPDPLLQNLSLCAQNQQITFILLHHLPALPNNTTSDNTTYQENPPRSSDPKAALS